MTKLSRRELLRAAAMAPAGAPLQLFAAGEVRAVERADPESAGGIPHCDKIALVGAAVAPVIPKDTLALGLLTEASPMLDGGMLDGGIALLCRSDEMTTSRRSHRVGSPLRASVALSLAYEARENRDTRRDQRHAHEATDRDPSGQGFLGEYDCGERRGCR